jgi:hypothetical protein
MERDDGACGCLGSGNEAQGTATGTINKEQCLRPGERIHGQQNLSGDGGQASELCCMRGRSVDDANAPARPPAPSCKTGGEEASAVNHAPLFLRINH